MESNLNLEKMLREVSAELREWKVLMEDLAGAFYNRFPTTRKYGWTLHLERCSEKKSCDLCPHSIYWVRYYYVTLSDQTREKMKKAGHEPPKSRVSWDNSKSGKSKDRLPARLRATRADKLIYKEYEAVRAEIMFQHMALSKLRKKLLGLVQYKKNDPVAQGKYFEHNVFKHYYMTMLPSKPIKSAVISKIYELRKA